MTTSIQRAQPKILLPNYHLGRFFRPLRQNYSDDQSGNPMETRSLDLTSQPESEDQPVVLPSPSGCDANGKTAVAPTRQASNRPSRPIQNIDLLRLDLETEILLLMKPRADEAKDTGTDPRILHRRSPGQGRFFTSQGKKDRDYIRSTRAPRMRGNVKESNKAEERDRDEKPDADPGITVSPVQPPETSKFEPIAPLDGRDSGWSFERSSFIEPPRSESEGVAGIMEAEPTESPIRSFPQRSDLLASLQALSPSGPLEGSTRIDPIRSFQSAEPLQLLRYTASRRSEAGGSP